MYKMKAIKKSQHQILQVFMRMILQNFVSNFINIIRLMHVNCHDKNICIEPFPTYMIWILVKTAIILFTVNLSIYQLKIMPR